MTLEWWTYYGHPCVVIVMNGRTTFAPFQLPSRMWSPFMELFDLIRTPWHMREWKRRNHQYGRSNLQRISSSWTMAAIMYQSISFFVCPVACHSSRKTIWMEVADRNDVGPADYFRHRPKGRSFELVQLSSSVCTVAYSQSSRRTSSNRRLRKDGWRRLSPRHPGLSKLKIDSDGE
jgi:hypothetical protein